MIYKNPNHNFLRWPIIISSVDEFSGPTIQIINPYVFK